MFTFLRKIRRSLIGSGSAGRPASSEVVRYLIYAIGEILLVMIGILLALQVNNWNENRKSNEFERILISELLNTIKSDFKMIETVIQGNERAQASCNTIISHFDAGLPYHDSLHTHFGYATEWWMLSLVENPYRNLESYGMHLLESDSARWLLNYIYDSRIPYFQNILDRHTQYHYNIVEPLYTELFEPSGRIGESTSFKKIPFDFESLKKNKRYRNILKTSIRDREKENAVIKQINDLFNAVVPILENEINIK